LEFNVDPGNTPGYAIENARKLENTLFNLTDGK